MEANRQAVVHPLLLPPPKTRPPVSLPKAPPRRSPFQPSRRWLGILVLFQVLGLFLFEAGRVTLGRNFHTVLPGQVYRSAQLGPDGFRQEIRRHGIQTVINLRGSGAEFPWYQAETEVLAELGVARHDIRFSSETVPAVEELARFVRILKTCRYPVLVHCRRGADRSGLASGLALLLRSNATVATARDQLSWRFGHLPLGRYCDLAEVFDLYEAWLGQSGLEHSSERFETWALRHYRPGPCWAEIEPLETPDRLATRSPARARFRATNRSPVPWRLSPAAHVGVHMQLNLESEDGSWIASDTAGFFDALVPPGSSIEFTLTVPAVYTPGRYRMYVDMVDGKRGWFSQLGSPRYEQDLVAAPAVRKASP